MTDILTQIIRCPVCSGHLENSEGSLNCVSCAKKFRVVSGIPNLYLDDDEVIARSDKSKHSEFIIDGKRLEALDKAIGETRIERGERRVFYKRISVFAIAGWVLAIVAGLLLLGRVAAFAVSWSLIIGAAAASLGLFIVDFVLYRISLNERYRHQVKRLVQLYKNARLSEFDIHEKQEVEPEEDTAFDPLEDAPKAAEISERLHHIKAPGKMGLNVGCGGELHKLISQPFFDHGYAMIGVDIFRTYVEQYSKLFKVNAIQANSMALPFKGNTLDMVCFCDIIEHLHHPYWWL